MMFNVLDFSESISELCDDIIKERNRCKDQLTSEELSWLERGLISETINYLYELQENGFEIIEEDEIEEYT